MRATVALLLALAAFAGLAACGDGDSKGGEPAETRAGKSGAAQSSKPATQKEPLETIVVRGGEPVGGVRELEYSAGSQVRFQVRSDVADEVHVHGYDLMEDVKAGGTVSFSFPADIEGIFEVELEDQQVQVAELRVNP